MHVFTYGTLQVDSVWSRVAREQRPTVPGVAQGHRVRRVRGADYPAMTPCEGDAAAGLVYHSVSVAAVERLDRFEGEQYVRRAVLVQTHPGQTLTCQAYLLSPDHAGDLSDEPWSLEDFLVSGALQRFTQRYVGFPTIEQD